MLDLTTNDFLTDVLTGLTAPRKFLQPKWFYDHRGSELFEDITRLPEYYLGRTETAILRANAGRIAGLVPSGGALIELGSGASLKTRLLLDQGQHFGAYVPLDIAESFLDETCHALKGRYPSLNILPVVGDFLSPITLPEGVRDRENVAFFPGSTIGNLSEDQAVTLLSQVRHWPGIKGFVLGADLVKPIPELIAAYDDAAGVTAAFNLNILHRIRRELGVDIDVTAFRHEARWNAAASAIEMHLVAVRAVDFSLAGHRISFGAGESIHTETCRKYDRARLAELAVRTGWQGPELLTDDDNRFAVAILRP